MKSASALYRLLGDDARLRLLRLLARERLNVSELTGILGLAQSGVSRHLGLLKDAGLVAETRDGGYAYYEVARDARSGERHAGVWPLLESQFAAASDRAVKADDARLQEVLRLRKENFHAHAAEGRKGQLVPGKSWAAWSRALGHLLPPLVVADLGCGEGYLTVEAARWAKRVVAVDRSEAVLRQARALARRRRVRNVIWKRGEIEKLPMADASVDVALLSQALHHAVEPARALGEAARVVAPGGKVIVLDLRVHDQAWVRDRLGDQWLGFQDGEIERLMKAAGLRDVKVGVGARKTGDPFTVLVASGQKPGGDAEGSAGATRRVARAQKTKRERP